MLLILLSIKLSNLSSTLFMYRSGVYKYYILEITKSILGLVLALSLYYLDIFNLNTYLFSLLIISIISFTFLKVYDLKIIFKLRLIEFIESGYINIYNLYRVSLFLGAGSVFAILFPFFDKFNNLINSQFLFYFNKFKVHQNYKTLKHMRSYVLIVIFFSVLLYILLNTFDISFIFNF